MSQANINPNVRDAAQTRLAANIETRDEAQAAEVWHDEAKIADPFDVKLGGKVRDLRVARSLTQAGLAEKSGVTFQQIQKYERGVNRIAVARLQQIADALGVSPAYFFADDDAAAELSSGIPAAVVSAYNRMTNDDIALMNAMAIRLGGKA